MTEPTKTQLRLFDQGSAWQQEAQREPVPPPPSPGPLTVKEATERQVDTEELLRLLNVALDVADGDKPSEAAELIIDVINLVEDRRA